MSSCPLRTGMVNGLKQDLTPPFGQDLPCHSSRTDSAASQNICLALVRSTPGTELSLLYLGPSGFLLSCLLLWAPDGWSQWILVQNCQSSSRTPSTSSGAQAEGKTVPHVDSGSQVAELTFASRLSWALLEALTFTRWCLIFLLDKSSRLWAVTEASIWCCVPLSWLADLSNVTAGSWISAGKFAENKKKKTTNQFLHEAGNC